MTEEIKSKVPKFWMVARLKHPNYHQQLETGHSGWTLHGQPSFMFPSFESAMNEAKRLCVAVQDSSFIVLEATHEAKTEQPPVVVNTIE